MKRRQFLSAAAALPALAFAAREEGVELTLTAAARSPQSWTYNGTAPGPLIEAYEGERVRVLFRNRLPQPSTIHWHGLSIPAGQDGSPLAPVAPGGDRLYEFTLATDCAGTYWYHPHVHGLTAEQVSRGLAGMFIVRSRHDPLEHLPDVPIVVTDARGREGDGPLVNGQRLPRLAIGAGETQRWRLLNATGARYLRLSLSGRAFTLAGTDGGLLATSVAGQTELTLAPAERAEILVTSTEAGGALLLLRALPYDGGGMMMGMGMGMGPRSRGAVDLLELETVAPRGTPAPAPAALRAIEPLPRAPAAQRFVLAGGMMSGFTINGRRFDMERIDAESRVGEVQRWLVQNASAMDHPFHLHGTRFQVLSRTTRGREIPEPRLAWKDTVNVRPGETASIAFVHEHPGLWMYHCHILEHEDAGMMGVLRVT